MLRTWNLSCGQETLLTFKTNRNQTKTKLRGCQAPLSRRITILSLVEGSALIGTGGI